MFLKADLRHVTKGCNEFACNLYRQLAKEENGNLCFSPTCISMALAMVLAGSKGETAAELAKLLHLELPSSRINRAFRAMRESSIEGVEFRFANRLWPATNYPISSNYADELQDSYGASPQTLDYTNDTEGARQIINTWVEKQTRGRITDLIPPGVLTQLTRLTLTSAIYFLGKWENEFEEQLTEDRTFHLTAAESIQAPTMYQSGSFRTEVHEGCDVVEIPYDKDYSMVIMVPRELDGQHSIWERPDVSQVLNWAVPSSNELLDLYLPKFRLTFSRQLEDSLIRLGAKLPFSESADFTLLSNERENFLDSILHKAFVEVNEEGTEAAAATGMIVRISMPSPTPRVVRVDRPFLFLIRDNRTGLIHFLGRVMDPSKA